MASNGKTIGKKRLRWWEEINYESDYDYELHRSMENACKLPMPRVIFRLVRKGFDVNVPVDNIDGMSFLHFAAYHGYPANVKALLGRLGCVMR